MEGTGKIKSLKVVRTAYSNLLTKYLPHRNYFDSFKCAQTPVINDEPSKADFKLSKSYLKFDLPYPVSDPEIKPLTVDPCFDLVKRKTLHLSKLSWARRKYEVDREWLTKDRVLNEEVQVIPDYLYDLTNGEYADPDVYFKAKYDYYYNGGNLCKIRDGQEQAVIYSDVNGNIFCTNVSTEETQPLTVLKNGGLIYNIKSFENKYITVRQKAEINLLKVKYKGGRYKSSQTINLNSPDYPFMDSDLLNCSEMCYTDANGNLKLMDLEEGSCKVESVFKVKNEDKLLLVKYLEPDLLALMSRDYVAVFDARSGKSSEFSQAPSFLGCNDYCCFTRSVGGDCLYIATKHNVLKFDLRNKRIVKKWTHFLSLDPVVVKTEIFGNEEMLCVGGFMETVCFPTCSGNFMPVQLTKPALAFDECKLRKRMVLREDLEKRFRMGTVGVEFVRTNTVPDSPEYAYFTCNSVGDVFRHNLVKKHVNKMNIMSPSKPEIAFENSEVDDPPTQSDSMTVFMDWAESVPVLRHHTYASSVVNNRPAKKFLLKCKPQEDEEEEERDDEKLDALLGYIDRYKDHNLAGIWGSDVPKVDVEGVLTSVTPENKVSEWLMNTHPLDDSVKEEA